MIKYDSETKEYSYFDKYGKQIHEGDKVFDEETGKTREIYLTESGLLGTDATNPLWIENGRAVPCEFGIYPLEEQELAHMRVVA